ncbi:hypothetical protein B0H14DRAFT_2602659 [Mycena olivaceomarginata]|nr:hypothetical protein B0H14DRAFT_2602659 [Mycena olivaceomarginata]
MKLFAGSPELFASTLAGDTLKLAGEVRFWNMAADAQRTVFMLLDDHAGGTGNVTLTSSGVSTAVSGRYSAAWYTFTPRPSHVLTSLSLDAIAGIKSLRFVVDGKLEDQGGVGFAVQDGVVFSETSCSTPGFHRDSGELGNRPSGSTEVAIGRSGNGNRSATICRVFLVQVGTVDSVDRQIVVETNIPRPAQPVSANTNYSIWSIELTDENSYFIGAEVDGVKFSGNDDYGAAALGPCAA